jgi:hypothetical protein
MTGTRAGEESASLSGTLAFDQDLQNSMSVHGAEVLWATPLAPVATAA